MKTTKKDFQDYQKWVRFYVKKFGLTDYQLFFEHGALHNANAMVATNITGRNASFSLSTFIHDNDMIGRNMKFFARHEVCHLLIADVSDLVGDYCTKAEHQKQDEALVVRLTDLLSDIK